jgi:hypothetical protein
MSNLQWTQGYSEMEEESIGHWWILYPRKGNGDNALVYEGFL